jgi:hypothetical protein
LQGGLVLLRRLAKQLQVVMLHLGAIGTIPQA